MKETDLQNLDAVFAYARQTVVNNEQELINIITYKKDLFERIKSLIKEEENLNKNT
jgi:hypothetical protein